MTPIEHTLWALLVVFLSFTTGKFFGVMKVFHYMTDSEREQILKKIQEDN